MTRARRFLAHAAPVAVVLVITIALAIWLHHTSGSLTVSSGGSQPVIVDPAFTRDDIDRIASGEPADPARPTEPVLLRSILAAAKVHTPHYPGRRAVEVGYATGAGRRIDVWSLGWPTPWVSRLSMPQYEDPQRRIGLKTSVTDPAAVPLTRNELPPDPLNIPPRPRWEWRGDVLRFQPPPEETGGIDTVTSINLFAPAAVVGSLILVWYISGLLLVIINRVLASHRRIHTARLRIVLAMIAGAGIIVASLCSATTRSAPHFTNAPLTQVGVPPATVYWSRAGYARLRWTRAELEQLATMPDADLQLATEIQRLSLPEPAASATGAGAPAYLAAVTDCETQYQSPGCTVSVISPALRLLRLDRLFFVRSPNFGTPEVVAVPAGLSFEIQHDHAFIGLSTGDADRPVYRLGVQINILGAIIVGLWLCFFLTRLLTVVRARIIRAKRRARGQCQACAYPLPPSPAAAAPTL